MQRRWNPRLWVGIWGLVLTPAPLVKCAWEIQSPPIPSVFIVKQSSIHVFWGQIFRSEAHC